MQILLTHTISILLQDLIILKHKCDHLQPMFLLVLFRTKIKCSYSAFVFGGAYKIFAREGNIRMKKNNIRMKMGFAQYFLGGGNIPFIPLLNSPLIIIFRAEDPDPYFLNVQ